MPLSGKYRRGSSLLPTVRVPEVWARPAQIAIISGAARALLAAAFAGAVPRTARDDIVYVKVEALHQALGKLDALDRVVVPIQREGVRADGLEKRARVHGIGPNVREAVSAGVCEWRRAGGGGDRERAARQRTIMLGMTIMIAPDEPLLAGTPMSKAHSPE